jgi:hypothetical protein
MGNWPSPADRVLRQKKKIVQRNIFNEKQGKLTRAFFVEARPPTIVRD